MSNQVVIPFPLQPRRSPEQARRAKILSRLSTARGIVMATVPCAKEQAWQALVEVSQHSNVKLRDVARYLVAGFAGDEPGLERSLWFDTKS